jgi:urease accessory protein
METPARNGHDSDHGRSRQSGQEIRKDAAGGYSREADDGPWLRADSRWCLWQLVDSAFPTGGFAHSSGLEAAWQHGALRAPDDFRSWLGASLSQAGRAAIPFINAIHADPSCLADMDSLCDAFTTNHVANRASRSQGRALRSAATRIFPGFALSVAVGHLAPVFGALTRTLGISHEESVRLFLFQHVRGVVGAAVRLNIIGPMGGQALQFQFGAAAEELARRSHAWTVDDLAQTSPLLEIWQGTQDRLYSRLFQS